MPAVRGSAKSSVDKSARLLDHGLQVDSPHSRCVSQRSRRQGRLWDKRRWICDMSMIRRELSRIRDGGCAETEVETGRPSGARTPPVPDRTARPASVVMRRRIPTGRSRSVCGRLWRNAKGSCSPQRRRSRTRYAPLLRAAGRPAPDGVDGSARRVSRRWPL